MERDSPYHMESRAIEQRAIEQRAMKAVIIKVMADWIRAEASKGIPVQTAEALEMHSMLEKTLLLYQAEVRHCGSSSSSFTV